MAAHRIDSLKAPLLVSWQLTRDCDLCCVHCCTESAPGKKLPDELDAEAAFRIAAKIVRSEVPYVMLCGGEPLLVPHFLELAELLGLDADTPEVYARQRAGGVLEKAHAACRTVRAAGLPLEITFAPTRINIHEAQAVIERAAELGAFRFNTGKLMRIGTAARLWERLEPDPEQYLEFLDLLYRSGARSGNTTMELCYEPFSMEEGLRDSLGEPPATLLVLPNGTVKPVAALPYLCADLRRDTLAEAWEAYRRTWRNDVFASAMREAIADESTHAQANAWRPIVGISRPVILETP
jgi:MoaA/NifB/PqqE/SkfB family radical SAM enzyme